MKLSKIQTISIRIVLLFVTAMLFSFIPELIPKFFGDTICIDGTDTWNRMCSQGYKEVRHVKGTIHWGYRHWLFLAMGIALFIVQVIDIINYADKPKY